VTGRIFLLSPANCGGSRAKQALSPNATFALAVALRSSDGAPLGDLFSFMSGLYFRGKLTYARRFARSIDPDNPIVGSGIHIITANAGDGNLVETTPNGSQVAFKTVDTVTGAGSLFGLAIVRGGQGIYFVDDGDNTLKVLESKSPKEDEDENDDGDD